MPEYKDDNGDWQLLSYDKIGVIERKVDLIKIANQLLKKVN
jgi:hypothetical protein